MPSQLRRCRRLLAQESVNGADRAFLRRVERDGPGLPAPLLGQGGQRLGVVHRRGLGERSGGCGDEQSWGACSYDPALGRFTQPDLSGQETNAYLYATGDPINNIDPKGTLSVGGITGIGDWVSLLGSTLTGDTEGARATQMGMLTGIGIEGLCLAGAAAGTFTTLGLSLAAGFTDCSVIAAGAAAATTTVYSTTRACS